MVPVIALELLDEQLLPSLLAAAVTEADPADVMPLVAGGPGWTFHRREAFLEFHRSRWARLPAETTYVVLVAGRVAGAARLAPVPEVTGLEVGIWLGRSYRGRGIGTKVLALLRIFAARRGAERIIADTTQDNIAARTMLDRAGAELSSQDAAGGIEGTIDLRGAHAR